MRPFAYARPKTLAEAVAVLEEHGSEASLLAGGTDLVVALRDGKITPRVVVDVKRVSDLPATIDETDGWLRIGATCVLTDIVEDGRIKASFPALAEAAAVVGSIQIRNRATLAGNLCNASPAADTAPPLLVYGAEVELTSGTGMRRVALSDFFVGPGKTVLRPGEILTAIHMPLPDRPIGAAFGRITRRRGVDLATVNLCCLVNGDGITKFAFGAVGPRPFVVADATGLLADRSAPDEDREAVLRSLAGHATPISDLRGSAAYRRAMLVVVGRRALEASLDRLAEAA